MSRYYNIPNKVNLPIKPPSTDIDPIFICKSKTPIIIENEKKTSWPIKHRHPNISISKENTPPRRITTQHKLNKPWQTVVKTTVPKPGESKLSVLNYLILYVLYRSSIDV
jgi:hypothetical protein